MSGVRCQDAELMSLGLTLPGFVERSEVIASLPSLGLLTLAGLTPAHHQMEYLEVPDLKAVDHLPGEFDLVAISSFSAQIREAYELADRYRREGTRVILGGLHVTACPDEAQAHADAIVIGEGEPVWRDVLADAEHKALKPRYDARQMPFNLANAPMPRFDLLDPQKYNRYTVQTQRGCVFDCEFCAASIRLAPGFKVKPVPKVIAEIRSAMEHANHCFIEFADDNTFVDKRRGRELMRQLAPLQVRWFTETDISVADDPELLALMRDAGCAQILIGLESPQQAPLSGLERKADWKARRQERYFEAIQRIQDHGITVNGCFVLGLDGSDPHAFESVETFVRESGLYEVQVTLLTPFPGTPLYRRLEAEGRLTHPGAWDRCTLFDLNFRPQNMSSRELESGFRELVTRLYCEEATRDRRHRFWERRRELRQVHAL